MSQPGWFPDPAGQPGQFRYWDGAQWSQETTHDPRQASTPGFQPEGGGGAGRWIGVVAVLLVMALVGWLVMRGMGATGPGAKEDTNSSTPTVSGWDETTTPTPTPTPSDPDSTGATMVDCPSGGGNTAEVPNDRIRSGNLSAERLGWKAGGFSLPWMYEVSAETKQITFSWFSVSAVGLLKKSDGFKDVKQAARASMSCFATSGYYRGFTGRTDVSAEAYEIDGKAAYRMRAEVRVDDQGSIEGDVIDIVAVDTGDSEHFNVYVSSATIGDATTIAEVDRARQSLKVG